VSVETVSRETQLDPWYVTGLIDGIGSFTYSRSGRQLAVYFAVKLGAKVNAPPPDGDDSTAGLLGDLKRFFSGGAIYASATSSYFRVQRRDDLVAVVDHFDRFPLRAKREVYEVWREMVIAKRAFRKPDRNRLDTLAQELSALTR
jgi:hypothetical protein